MAHRFEIFTLEHVREQSSIPCRIAARKYYTMQYIFPFLLMVMGLGLTLEGKPYGIILLLFSLLEFICKAGLCECQ